MGFSVAEGPYTNLHNAAHLYSEQAHSRLGASRCYPHKRFDWIKTDSRFDAKAILLPMF